MPSSAEYQREWRVRNREHINAYHKERHQRMRREAGMREYGTEELSYQGAHHRVVAARGKATEHTCGCGEPAQEWAYDHNDPNERTGKNGAAVCRYSTDPQHYLPLCIPCHREFDDG